MNPARRLVLIVAMCALPISELAKEAHFKDWIRLNLYQEGYQSDRAGDYVTAFKKLSDFWKVNSDRLAEATTSDEIAFRDWLDARIRHLAQKIREDRADQDEHSNVRDGVVPQGDSAQTGQKTSRFTGPSADANTGQSNNTHSSGQIPMPTPPPPGANTGQSNNTHSSGQIPMRPVPKRNPTPRMRPVPKPHPHP